MVKIRLRRVGAKKQASYRVVVADSRSPRDGRFIERIGIYNPRTDPETVRIKEDRALHWLSVGAQPTDAVARLLKNQGTLARFERLKQGEPLETLVAEAEEALATEEGVVEAEEVLTTEEEMVEAEEVLTTEEEVVEAEEALTTEEETVEAELDEAESVDAEEEGEEEPVEELAEAEEKETQDPVEEGEEDDEEDIEEAKEE
jgi:small subunit ribosomal protein S16